ncbi:MAG: tetratricopeptide repeat protein, partial [Gemmatimonadetes bacterium]
ALQISLDGIAADPDNPQSYFHAGVAYLGLKQYAQADSMLDKAEWIWPEYIEQIEPFRENAWIQAYNDALGRIEAGDERGAAELFEMANLVYDKRPEAYLNLGNTYANMGEFEKSVEAYRKAIEVVERPESKEERDEETYQQWQRYRLNAKLNMAQMLLLNDRAEEAIDLYNEILEEDPDNKTARSNLAVAMAQTGQSEAALGIYEELLNNPEASVLDLYNAGVGMYQAENFEGAATAFEKVVERSPMNRDALQNLAQTLAISEQWERLAPYAKRLVELDPYNEFAYRFYARALVATGEEQEAVAQMEKMQALPFTVDNMQFRGAGRIAGSILNKSMEPGTEVTLRFHFYDEAGNEIGTQDVTVTLGAQDTQEVFQLKYEGEGELAGYGYEVVTS